ncbi:hypothetical protein [Oricola sp.]|uniref:hypothetical protein n=1 Tax=Oricola sp. TaxID=1979950 RepID=UPI0035187FA5
MSEEPEPRPSARALLQDTPETAERFHGYGLKDYSYPRIGLEESVHRNTVMYFLQGAPQSRRRYQEGKAEARMEKRNARLAGIAPERGSDRPAPGEICPTCGGLVGFQEETVTLTTAELAEARRKYEDLIDRHLSAQTASCDEGGGQ